jgi:hypothetical protein
MFCMVGHDAVALNLGFHPLQSNRATGSGPLPLYDISHYFSMQLVLQVSDFDLPELILTASIDTHERSSW